MKVRVIIMEIEIFKSAMVIFLMMGAFLFILTMVLAFIFEKMDELENNFQFVIGIGFCAVLNFMFFTSLYVSLVIIAGLEYGIA